MVRDVRNFKVTEVITRKRSDGLTYYTNLDRNSVRSSRSDPVSTSPLPDGSYGRPTTYEAIFGFTSSGPGECEFQEGLGSTNPLYRTWTHKWTGGSDWNTITHGCDAYGVPAVPTVVISRARSAAIDAVRSNNLNLAVSIGEIRSTVRTIGSLLNDVANIVKRFRTLTPRAIAREWLRYQYGIKPLMSDIFAACEIIQNGLKVPAATLEVVRMDDSFMLPLPTTTRTFFGSVRRGCEISYTYSVRNPQQFELWRYGVLSPLSLTWELTTLSFVVDWFTGVGSFLEGLEGPKGLDLFGGYQTLFLDNNFVVREQRHPNPVPFGGPGNWIVVTKPGWSEVAVRTKAMSRSVLNSFAAPLPYLDLGLNLNRTLSAVALIVSRRP